MKRSFLVFAITLLTSATLSLATYYFFGLVLTLPLIICGVALLISQRYIKHEAWKLLSINSGILLSAIGIIFFILNLNTFLSNKKPFFTNEGDYEIASQMLKNRRSQGLGYSYPPNLKNYSSRKIAHHLDSTKEVIYDVTYNTDSLSNRYTPYDKTNGPNKLEAILFLGGSLTFGEGLNDNETLSFFVQSQTGRATLNSGLHGYGAHQALRILEDQNLYNKRTKGHNVKTIIYRPIVRHINRTAGYSPWDTHGPCYELFGLNSVSYKGSFAECGRRGKSFWTKILHRLTNTSEPFTNKIFDRFTLHGNYYSRNFLEEDVDRFVAVVSRMNSIAESKGINFFVVLEDVKKDNELCGIKVPYAHDLIKRFTQERLNLILTSKVYTEKICIANELTISEYDRHPTMIANKLLSEYLIGNRLVY